MPIQDTACTHRLNVLSATQYNLPREKVLTLHVDLPPNSEHPVPTRLRNLPQLSIPIKFLGVDSRLLIQGSSRIGRIKHRLGRAGEEGVDVVDFLVHLGNGDVMKPRLEPLGHEFGIDSRFKDSTFTLELIMMLVTNDVSNRAYCCRL